VHSASSKLHRPAIRTGTASTEAILRRFAKDDYSIKSV
jgi:hypothetical protein